MKNVWNKVWNVIKIFPLTLFGIFMLLAGLFVQVSVATYDSQGLGGGLTLLMILLNPVLLLATNFAEFLGFGWLVNLFNQQLFGICIFLFLIDILIIFVRRKLIPCIKSKINKESNNHDAS